LAEFRNGVNYNKNSFGVGIKVVGVSDFQDYTKPRYGELEQINPEGIVTERNILRDGDIVFVRSNGNRELIGRSLFIEQPPEEVTHSAFSIRLRFTSRDVHPKFYAYCFRTPLIRQGLTAQGGGTNISNLNQDILNALEVPFPPLPVQRRIAGILSAYDELMENSQRRIRLLEAMARALYREWFVHFRIPAEVLTKAGSDPKLPRVPSPLGDIPQGWEICALGEFVLFKSGFAFKSGTFTADGEHRLVTIKNVQDGSFNPESASRMSELPEKMPHYCVLADGDILLSLTGNVGRVCLVYDGPFLLNQRVSKLMPVESFDWAMTYCLFREPETRVKLEQLSTGVAQQNLSPVLASKMEFARPPRELRQRFAVLAEPMVRRIVKLCSTIQNLRRTRDLLLPRLLSGQIDLKS
jgi:type I restriction enzyme S subunit